MKYIKIIFVCTALALSGCALADYLLIPDPVTGVVPARAMVEAARPALPAPWGEALLGAVILIQNSYLGGKRLRNRMKKS